MIDLFLRLIDKLIELARVDTEVNRKLFEDHVDPIYRDLRSIIDQYIALFRMLEQDLLNPNVSVVGVLRALEIRRRESERLREELRTYSRILAETDWARGARGDVEQFATACYALLNREPSNSYSAPHQSRTLGFLAEIEEAVDQYMQWPDIYWNRELPDSDHDPLEIARVPRELLSAIAMRYRSGVERNWSRVIESYYSIRARTLK